MRRLGVILATLILGLVLVTVGCARAPRAMSAADFYRENTVTIICPFGAGGGIDYAARLFASYWPEVTGGTMIVKNMPGAGGVMGTNYVYKAKGDGLTLGNWVMANIGTQLFKDPAVEYDLRKCNWIGLIGADPYVLVVSSKLPYDSMEDLQKVEGFKLGAAGARTVEAQGSALLAELFGLKDAMLVVGFGGTADVSLSIARGEIDGYVFGSASTNEDVKKGFVKPPLVVMDWGRSAWWPDTPALPELVQMSPEQEALFRIYSAMTGGRPYFAPPGVPADRVQFLRDAFDKIVTMDGFLRQAKLRWKVWEKPMSGEEVAAVINEVLAITPEEAAKLSQLVDKYLR